MQRPAEAPGPIAPFGCEADPIGCGLARPPIAQSLASLCHLVGLATIPLGGPRLTSRCSGPRTAVALSLLSSLFSAVRSAELGRQAAEGRPRRELG